MNFQALRPRFQSDGYVAIPGFVNGQELVDLHANLDRYIRDVIPKMPSERVFYEDKSRQDTLKQFGEMDVHDPYFAKVFREGRFLQLAEALLDDRAVPKRFQFFNKPPSSGKPTPPHQDGFYFHLEPCEALTMWLALDPVDEENGCVRYVRGSHCHGMREHARSDVLGFSQMIQDYGQPDDVANEVAMLANPGDLLVHHALTIHRADGNQSTTRPRRSLGLVYFAESSVEDISALQAYEQRLKSDLIAAGKV